MQSWAVLAQDLVEEWARPYEPRDTPNDQIHRAYKRLRGHQLKAGWSKVRRSYYGQAGEPTYLSLKSQAEKVRRELRDANDRYIDRLRWMQRNATADQAEALDWAIRQLEGTYVAGPPVR